MIDRASNMLCSRRKRWDPDKHMRWLKSVWGNKQVRLVDKYLLADRDDRALKSAK
jgi:hypothetical protein